jgi:hypothetical protein
VTNERSGLSPTKESLGLLIHKLYIYIYDPASRPVQKLVRVAGRLTRPVPDTFLVSGWPVLPCSACRVVFLGWVGFWVKIYGPCTNHGLLRVKNYGPYSPIVSVGRDGPGFFGRVSVGGLHLPKVLKNTTNIFSKCNILLQEPSVLR